MLLREPDSFRHEIALSFPGVMRPVAREIKAQLARSDSSLASDEAVFCEDLQPGERLQDLTERFADSVMIVPFFVAQYGTSEFCQLEWDAIRTYEEHFGGRVCPIRFDDSSPGHRTNDLNAVMAAHKTVPELCHEIVQRWRELRGTWQSKDRHLLILQDDAHGSTKRLVRRVEEVAQAHRYTSTIPDMTPLEAAQHPGDMVVVFSGNQLVRFRQLSQVLVNTSRRVPLIVPRQTPPLLVNDVHTVRDGHPYGLLLVGPSHGEEWERHAEDYLSAWMQPLVNVFYAGDAEIADIRRQLFANHGSGDVHVRWHDLSHFTDDQLERRSTLSALACRMSVEYNVFIISRTYMDQLRRSRFLALLPTACRQIRSEIHKPQKFWIIDPDVTSRSGDRDDLKHYWLDAQLMVSTGPEMRKELVRTVDDVLLRRQRSGTP